MRHLPPPELRAAILAQATRRRSWIVAVALARLFDLDRARVDALVDSLDDADAWIAGPLPGLFFLHVAAGPACAGAYTGFARMTPGLRFPGHEHLGPERMLVVEGGIRLDDGRELHAGATLDSEAGSAHDFVVLPGEECLAAVVQFGGVRFS
jgi:hypothetical protein